MGRTQSHPLCKVPGAKLLDADLQRSSGSGSNQFALSCASRTANLERAELGSWVNSLYLLQGNSVVSLFGRTARAHDWQNLSQASTTFLGLAPIAAFIVNGAKPAADLGVVTAGAELRMAYGLRLAPNG
jgi:hypothetical protein